MLYPSSSSPLHLRHLKTSTVTGHRGQVSPGDPWGKALLSQRFSNPFFLSVKCTLPDSEYPHL